MRTLKVACASVLLASALGCESDDAASTAATDGQSDGQTDGTAADGADGTDGAAAGLQDPVLPDWPSEQPGVSDPEARQWFRAGARYKLDPDELDDQMVALFGKHRDDQPLARPQAIITPHAGSKACGETAAKVWANISPPDLVIVLAPNHIKVGKTAAIWNGGPWLVPGLAVPTRRDVIDRFLELLPEDLDGDQEAFEHQNAHPSEMQLPYLTRKNPNVEVVFISLFDNEKEEYPEFTVERAERVGKVVAQVVTELQEAGEEVLVIGTTDLSHYEPMADVDAKDEIMMDAITRFDTVALRQEVVDGDFTICGEIAMEVFITAMKQLGYTGLDVSFRGNSAHMIQPGGKDSVVGYPGGIIWR